MVGDLSEGAQGQGPDRGPLREYARPVRQVARQPRPQRVRGVGLHTDRERDRGVELESVGDAGQRVDHPEPGEFTEPDPPGPHRDERRDGQQHQRPTAHRVWLRHGRSRLRGRVRVYGRGVLHGLLHRRSVFRGGRLVGGLGHVVVGRAVRHSAQGGLGRVRSGLGVQLLQDRPRLLGADPELTHEPVPRRNRTQVRRKLTRLRDEIGDRNGIRATGRRRHAATASAASTAVSSRGSVMMGVAPLFLSGEGATGATRLLGGSEAAPVIDRMVWST